jgi:hypothetical protein
MQQVAPQSASNAAIGACAHRKRSGALPDAGLVAMRKDPVVIETARLRVQIELGRPSHGRLLDGAALAQHASERSVARRSVWRLLAPTLCCLALSLLGAPPAAARPSWSAPVNLAAPERGLIQPASALVTPAVAMDRRGDAVAVWEGPTGIRASSQPAGKSWQAPVTISGPGSPPSVPALAMDPQGDALAVWQRRAANGFEEIQAASRRAGESWQAPITLSENALTQERLQTAMDARGDAFVVWVGAASVQAATLPSGGSWQKAENLSVPVPSEAAAYNSGLTVSAKGDAIAIWISETSTNTLAVRSAARLAGGTWQTPVTLSGLSGGHGLPSIASDPQGEAVAVWESFEQSLIQTALRPAGGSWHKRQELFAAPAHGEEGSAPQVAMDSHGDAIAVGVGSRGSRDTIRAVWRPVGKSWQSPLTLYTAPGRVVPQPQMAMSPSGEAVAVWASYKGSGTKALIESAIRQPGGSWQTPVKIATVSLQQFEVGHETETAVPAPRVAIDPEGKAVAVWFNYSHGDDVVQVAHLEVRAAHTRHRPATR